MKRSKYLPTQVANKSSSTVDPKTEPRPFSGAMTTETSEENSKKNWTKSLSTDDKDFRSARIGKGYVKFEVPASSGECKTLATTTAMKRRVGPRPEKGIRIATTEDIEVAQIISENLKATEETWTNTSTKK